MVKSHRTSFHTLQALACLCGLYFTLAVPTSGVSYDVYLLAGQSNMDGRGLTNDLTGGFAVWNQPQTNVLVYYQNNSLTNYTASWQSLKPGWSEDSGALAPAQFGPELSIGYVLATANRARRIALIKISRGGTSLLSDWRPTKNMYTLLTNAVPVALQALATGGNTYTVRGMLWHQGEADFGETQEFYLTLLTNFITSVRTDLGLPNLPFVIGEINRDNPNPNYQIIRQAQYAASQMISNTYFVTAMNLPATISENHFYSTAVIGLGQRFGSQANAFLPGPATTQTWDLAGSGTWSTNSARWTADGGATHHAWSNGNDAAVFVSTGGNSTVTISNTITAYSLMIATNATGYNFMGGTLATGNGGVIANESAGIGASLNVDGLQGWSVPTGKTLTVNGPINLSIHTLNIGGDGATVLAGVISDVSNDPTNSAFLYDSTVLLKSGNGTLTMLSSNIFMGAVMIRGGTVQLGDGVSSNGLILRNIENNATLVFANPFAQTYAGILSGTGLVVKAGPGTLTLVGSNSYAGGTIINGGTLSISADRHLGGFGIATLDNGGVLQVTGTNDTSFGRAILLGAAGGGFDVNAASNNFTVSSPISGSGGLTKTGGGALTIAYTPAYTGNTSVQQGTLNLAASPLSAPVNVAAGASLVLGPSSGLMGEYYNISPLNVSNSNPKFASLTALNNHLAGVTPNLWFLNGAAGTNFDFAFSGSGPTKFPNPFIIDAHDYEVRWTGKFIAPSTGTYTFSTTSDDGSMLWVDGNNVVSNNAFQGLTTKSGTMSLTAGLHDIVIGYYQGNNTYGLYAEVILPGGSLQRLPNSLLQFGATAFAVGSLSGDTGSVVNLKSYPLTINQTTDGTFAGVMSGAGGSLIKGGLANFTLSGSNTFTGATTVNAGTLTLDYTSQNNNKISASGLLTLNGGILKIVGNASASFTQQVSGLFLPSNSGMSTIINQSGNTLLDFTSGGLSLGSGVSVNFLTTDGAGIRLPGTTNTLLGVWAVTDTGDPAFLSLNNFVVSLTNYSAALPAAGANPAGNYLNAVGIVTNTETANLLNLRDAPSLFISNGVVLGFNTGLLFPGNAALAIYGPGQLGATSSSLVINANATLGTNALIIGTPISAGSGSLNKLGPGPVIVTNNNTYNGGTTISGGILQIGNGGPSGTLGSGSITDNGTLVYNRSDAITITNNITGSGVLVQAGTNTVSINTPQSYMGGTVVNGGILLLSTPDQNRALAFNSSVTVNAGGAVLVTNVNNVQNDGSWTLNGGLVRIVGGGHQHFGPVTLNGGTVTTGPGSFAYDGTAGNYAIDGNVTVAGATPSTLDANTGINLGALVAGGVAVTFNVADATGDANPDLIVTTKLRDRDGGGARGIVKTGVGTMLIAAASDYTGATTISNGVFMLGHALAAQNSTVSNFVGGGLAFGSTNTFTIAGLAGTGDFALTNVTGGITLNIGVNGAINLYGGNMTGGGSLTKTGNGTLKLAGWNTYTGATTISNGTLALSGSGLVANSSAIVIVSNATLDVTGRNGGSMSIGSGQTLRGSGIIKGDLIVAGGATLSPGTSVGTLTCSNNLTVSSAATLQYELGNNSDRTIVIGNLALGGTLNIGDAGGFTNGMFTLFTYGGTLTYSGVTIGTRPNGSLTYLIDTNTAGQVKLSVTNGVVLDPFVQWQLQYFGCTNCMEAAPTADVTGTGQNNLFKYVAGLDPTNPASVFIFQIASVAGQPNQQDLFYNPVVAGRTYTVQFNTEVLTNGWSSLTGYAGPVTNGNQVTVTDLNATQLNKFYRLSITLP